MADYHNFMLVITSMQGVIQWAVSLLPSCCSQ